MSTTYVSKALRRLVAAQAKQRCGYCLSPQSITGTPMEIEHIVPKNAGGSPATVVTQLVGATLHAWI